MIDRAAVYNKFHGHCAYCGKQIDMKEMQVDHIVPKRLGGTSEIENLNPSCRSCNHYKRGGTVETLRQLLKTMDEKLMKIYIFRVALDYGIVRINQRDEKFYFEKETETCSS